MEEYYILYDVLVRKYTEIKIYIYKKRIVPLPFPFFRLERKGFVFPPCKETINCEGRSFDTILHYVYTKDW